MGWVLSLTLMACPLTAQASSEQSPSLEEVADDQFVDVGDRVLEEVGTEEDQIVQTPLATLQSMQQIQQLNRQQDQLRQIQQMNRLQAQMRQMEQVNRAHRQMRQINQLNRRNHY